jgi:hypothetical protein
MEAFSPDQWLILLLAFLLGLVLGLALRSNTKWKRRYREESALRADEAQRREALETERTHWEAKTIAERAREEERPPSAT